jgi:hypothetical protein
MITKLLGTAIAACILVSAAAPIAAYAADAPKTKAQCAKLKDMKWDAKTKTCMKK